MLDVEDSASQIGWVRTRMAIHSGHLKQISKGCSSLPTPLPQLLFLLQLPELEKEERDREEEECRGEESAERAGGA